MKYKVLIGGVIGVPITFLDKYNPDTGGGTNWLDLLIQHDGSDNLSASQLFQVEKSITGFSYAEWFKIIKFRKGNDEKDLCVNGICPYFRILIRRKI